jgi:hypothetical protein
MPRLGLLSLALLGCFTLQSTLPIYGQATPGMNQTTDLDSGANGDIPAANGFNASLNTSSQHDSSNGWSSALTPGVAYRFNRLFSFDASIPVYIYLVDYMKKGTVAKPVYAYQTEHHAPADTVLNAHVETHSDLADYNFTATLGLPTGNKDYGLGAGQVTYSINNHFEHGFDFFTPDVELGFGDSSSLATSAVRKSYVAVGKIAYFQTGVGLDLPLHTNFDAEVYEELPVAATTIYSTTGKGKKKVTTATNEGAAEDNGFNTSLDIPLNRHTILTGFYNRSLRNKIDTVGFSFTFLLRPAPLPHNDPE